MLRRGYSFYVTCRVRICWVATGRGAVRIPPRIGRWYKIRISFVSSQPGVYMPVLVQATTEYHPWSIRAVDDRDVWRYFNPVCTGSLNFARKRVHDAASLRRVVKEISAAYSRCNRTDLERYPYRAVCREIDEYVLRQRGKGATVTLIHRKEKRRPR